MLALTQARDGRRLSGIDQQLETSDTLERGDLASEQSGGGVVDCSVKFRSADRAGIGLRVKPAVGGTFVFFAAGRTQDKLAHRRVRPIVRDVDNNGVARATIGAIGERI